MVEVSRDFQLDYEINFFALNDFEEDLAFKFWASPSNLIRMLPYGKLIRTYGLLTAVENASRVASREIPLAIENASCGSVRASDVEMVTRFMPSGVLAAAGYKAYQWSGFSDWGTKLLMAMGCGYLGLYAFERLRWTKYRQEQSFRAQFARHASQKLRHSVEHTSSKCSSQVQIELTDTFKRLEFTANEVTNDIDEEIAILDAKSLHHTGVIEMAKKWKNKFDWLEIELRNYRKDYIPNHSRRMSNSDLSNDVFHEDALASNPNF